MESNNIKRINLECLKKQIEEATNINFSKLLELVKIEKIDIEEKDIINYLDDMFKLENPILYKTLKLRESINHFLSRYNLKKNDSNIVDNKIKRYIYYPDSLEYLKKYVSILRLKTINFLTIIDILSDYNNHDINLYEEIKMEYDLDIDDYSKTISVVDAKRLIEPALFNIKDLFYMRKITNAFSTYLTFKLSEIKFAEYNMSDDMYPKATLQIKDLTCHNKKGYIPLSENQMNELELSKKLRQRATNKNLV